MPPPRYEAWHAWALTNNEIVSLLGGELRDSRGAADDDGAGKAEGRDASGGGRFAAVADDAAPDAKPVPAGNTTSAADDDVHRVTSSSSPAGRSTSRGSAGSTVTFVEPGMTSRERWDQLRKLPSKLKEAEKRKQQIQYIKQAIVGFSRSIALGHNQPIANLLQVRGVTHK